MLFCHDIIKTLQYTAAIHKPQAPGISSLQGTTKHFSYFASKHCVIYILLYFPGCLSNEHLNTSLCLQCMILHQIFSVPKSMPINYTVGYLAAASITLLFSKETVCFTTSRTSGTLRTNEDKPSLSLHLLNIPNSHAERVKVNS